jgi:PAS domain-containing protein
MELGADATAVLEAISEPALVLDPDDRIAASNRRARVMLGSASAERDIHDLHRSPPDEVRRYLNRCRGSKLGFPGVVVLPRARGLARNTAAGARA